MVYVSCGGTLDKYDDKRDAAHFFSVCFSYCDPRSSEAGRYADIISQVNCGVQFASDGEPTYEIRFIPTNEEVEVLSEAYHIHVSEMLRMKEERERKENK